ncbi:AAA family ATPase [Corynebacterium cystitidis]|uniref:AAA family ATPase n=1 Tax=Corynebacterium cystitidis TaxID=35757 RepID=UPI00211E991C|nr:AAA family ATPase [Corynebacterium cystitidis]
MLIHSLRLDNVRGIEYLELTELPETGVIVIHGDNEAGKSTIMDAFRVVLTENHNAKNKSTRPLRPVHRDASPEVKLDATIGQYRLKIRKRWFSKALSELTVLSPFQRNFTGREADTKLAEIVAENMDADLVDTLFMRQDELPAAIDAVGIPSMTRALDAGSDETLAGTEDTELMERIEAEYQRYFTKTGRPVKSRDDRDRDLEEARDQLQRQQAEAAQLSSYVDEVARKKLEIDQTEAELPAAVEQVREREAEFAAAQKTREAAERAEERAAVATREAQQAVAEQQQRTQLVQRAKAAQDDVTRFDAQVADVAEQAAQEAESFDKLTAARATADQRVQHAREQLRQANANRELVRHVARLSEVREILGQLEAADTEVNRLRDTAPERPITDDDVRAVEHATNEVALQRRLNDATVAKLVVTSPSSGQIVVDGHEVNLDGATEVEMYDGTEVSCGEFSAHYHAAAGTEDGREALQRAERKVAELLGELGCADLEQVRTMRDTHRSHADQLEKARSQRATIVGKSSADDLRAEEKRLAQRVAELDPKLRELDDETAAELVEQAQQEETAATTELNKLDAALKPLSERTAYTALQVVEAKQEAAARSLKVATEELNLARERTPDEQLDAGVIQAQEAEDVAKEALATANEAMRHANPDVAEQLLAGARTKVETLKKRASDAGIRMAELHSHIQQAQGIAEAVDKTQARVDALEREKQRTDRRAAAIDMLRSTMHAHRDKARQRYSAPFTKALTKYAEVIFGPDVSFELDEFLQVTARTINGATVELEQLSGGAQEQLAVLTRFAIAELAGAGHGGEHAAPVIIDDALGATDPQRLALMNTLFSQVGKNNQVFILTCFPQRYDTVAAAARYSMDELKTQSSLL